MSNFIQHIKEHLKNATKNRTFSFKNLKTSTQISLKFTLFTVLQVLFFSIVANVIFFQTRYQRQHGNIPPMPGNIMIQKMVLGRNRSPELETFEIKSQEGQTVLNNHRWKSIAKIDDMYFMYRQIGNQLILTNVTPHVEVQKNLILISLYLMIVFGAFSYVISGIFVNSSLKKLNKLLGFLDTLRIDRLNEKIEITGHPDDEINRVSKKFNEAMEKIHKQTLSLKDFVTNASHELKTPLMSMNTEIDYTTKTKTYETGLHNIKQQLKGMNNLLETLVTISKIEAIENLAKEPTDISEITGHIIHDIEKIYEEKGIICTTHLQKDVLKQAHRYSRDIIVKNIIDNAFKFTPEGGTIDIALDDKRLIIKDSGKGISAQDLEHIRERFWQADRSNSDTKSFGLGLYLTKLLVEKHGWKIAISSKVNKGTTCTIHF